MESYKKLALLVVAVALVLQATVPPPTAFAARNELKSLADDAAKNPGNYLAMVLDVNRPGNCIPKGGWCLFDLLDCCQPCGCLAGFCWNLGDCQ